MKRIIALIMCIALFVAAMPIDAAADGDGNMNGGGGGMGGGTGANYWHEGEDGVRVTVVRASDNAPVSISIDLTNFSENNIDMHFGKKCILQYRNGSILSFSQSQYSYSKPEKPLPRVISNGGNANIAAIKSYFCSEWILKRVAELIGASYNTLINGNYKLLIEPIAYFTFQGYKMAMTATEAALYDQK